LIIIYVAITANALGTRTYIEGRLHYSGGAMTDDGSRSPRVATIFADRVLAVKSSNFQQPIVDADEE
jgi:hypothetical protein